jgi:tetratricopeptide (TPR) repeat protein
MPRFASRYLVVVAALAGTALQAQTARPAAAGARVPLYDNLGSLHRAVTTRVPLAQRYFDQGLRLYYAFNHPAAIQSFREAQRLDSSCAMCHWGEAMALGPDINASMDAAAVPDALAATARAVRAAANATPLERELVAALRTRYRDGVTTDRAALDTAFAAAMRGLATRHGDDEDILALAAEAQMQLAPWSYWTLAGAARPGTVQLIGWLERAMQLAPEHPGACHYYIHAVEAAQPAKAVACAERLARLMPGAGHLVHMPAHIYIRVGRWADAIDQNRHAVHADEEYFEAPGALRGNSYEAGYASHNWHFLAFAATMAGAGQMAAEAGAKAVQGLSPDLVRAAPSLEGLLPLRFLLGATFGRWDDVLRLPMPPADLRLASGLAHHARGIAFGARGRRAEARASLDSVRAFAARLPTGEPQTVLQIAALVLEADLQLRSGRASAAVPLLRRAVALEDGLTYIEPPTWHHPVRHALGKALLAARMPKDAERVYREDLVRFPENGWSLRGLAQALAAQGRRAEAAAVERRFDAAWRNADVQLTSSRF